MDGALSKYGASVKIHRPPATRTRNASRTSPPQHRPNRVYQSHKDRHVFRDDFRCA